MMDMMDAPERSNSNAQAGSPSAPSAERAPTPRFDHDHPHGQVPPSGRRSIARRLAGRWWQILLLWLLISFPLAYLIYTLVEPTYQAFSLLRVEPAGEPVYGSGRAQTTDDLETVKPYLQTQINLITSDRVLDPALASRTIANLRMVKESLDPKADVREKMTVEIVDKGTYLIRVALESPNPVEAAAVVNAVVESYLDQNTEYHRISNKNLRTSLELELKKVESAIQEKKAELKKLSKDGEPEIAAPRLNLGAPGKDADPTSQPALSFVKREQYAMVTDRLLQADLELIDAQAELEAAKTWAGSRSKPDGQPGKPDAEKGQGSTAGNSGASERLRELEAAVEKAKRKRIGYVRYIEKLKVEARDKNIESVDATLASQDLAHLNSTHTSLSQRLKQLEFESNQDRHRYRITVVDKAAVPNSPANNKRLKYMAAAPVGILFLLLGLSLIQELQAARGLARMATSSRPAP
jgi:uncharacterized protein involved in exopolysaccharide biosynthesis